MFGDGIQGSRDLCRGYLGVYMHIETFKGYVHTAFQLYSAVCRDF